MKSLKLQFAIGLWLALVLAFPATAEIYSWTDKDGVVHYSNREPLQPNSNLQIITAYPYDPAADEARWEADQKEWEALEQEIDAEDQQRNAEAQKQLREKELKEQDRPPTREEQIETEKIRLEKKIAELEEMPLSAFGSQKNKRMRLAIYHYKLSDLQEDPDTYFGWSKK